MCQMVCYIFLLFFFSGNIPTYVTVVEIFGTFGFTSNSKGLTPSKPKYCTQLVPYGLRVVLLTAQAICRRSSHSLQFYNMNDGVVMLTHTSSKTDKLQPTFIDHRKRTEDVVAVMESFSLYAAGRPFDRSKET